jgi:hypothetical protein
MSGWYAVQRGITAHHLFERKPERLAVWMWLMDNAAWKDTTHDVKGHTVVVPRGSVCVSERHIADKCGVGYQVVRTAIKRFASEQMINATPTHGKSLITLCNYGKYQDVNKDANAAPNATLTQRQRNPNAQKEQVNKLTKEGPKGPSDFEAVEILSTIVPQQLAKDFAAHRRGMGKAKALTPNAAAAMLKKLDGHHDPIAVLTDSIANGWQGIFPEKIKPNTNGGYNGQSNSNALHGRGAGSQATQRPDASLERIARLAGVVQTPGDDRL